MRSQHTYTRICITYLNAFLATFFNISLEFINIKYLAIHNTVSWWKK